MAFFRVTTAQTALAIATSTTLRLALLHLPSAVAPPPPAVKKQLRLLAGRRGLPPRTAPLASPSSPALVLSLQDSLPRRVEADTAPAPSFS